MLSGHLPLGYDSTPSDREGASVQQLAVHPTKAVKPAFPQATTAVEKFPELKAVRIALTCGSRITQSPDIVAETARRVASFRKGVSLESFACSSVRGLTGFVMNGYFVEIL
jgi:hypothetical protein